MIDNKKLMETAIAENFWGKRKLSSQAAVVETAIAAQNIALDGVVVEDIVEWLKKNKPTTSKKPIRESEFNMGQSHISIDTSWAGRPGYILTSAQNNTLHSAEFLAALQQYAATLDYTILCSPFSYNKGGMQTLRAEGKTDLDYSEALRPYLVDRPVLLYDNLVFAAELDIIPTTAYPVNGRSNYHGSNSIVIPHAKVQLRSYAASIDDTPKFVWSTGAITPPNYIKANAGQKAEAEHCIAAVVVHACDESSTGYQVRQLHWDGRQFIDLEAAVTPRGITAAPPAASISFGDLHSEKMDWDSLKQACELADSLQVEYIQCHDTFDMASRNHHNRNDPWFLASQGGRTVRDDLAEASKVLHYIVDNVPSADTVYVVASNHDEALESWLRDPRYDFRQDLVNAELYLALQQKAISELTRFGVYPESVLELALNTCGASTLPVEVEFLRRQDTVKIDDVIVSMHGDSGNNGSKATPVQLARTYDKCTTGHTHSPSIYGGCYTGGVTGCLDMGYNTAKGGGSSWAHAHIVQYANGHRAVVIY